MAEFFASLTRGGGVKFNKERFGAEMELFKNKGDPRKSSSVNKPSAGSLDFFGKGGAAAGAAQGDRGAGAADGGVGNVTASRKAQHAARAAVEAEEEVEAAQEEAEEAKAAACPTRSAIKKAKKAKVKDDSQDLDPEVDIFSTKAKGAGKEKGADESAPSTAGPKQTAVEAANLLRKEFRIKVVGGEAPAPLRSFADLQARYGASEQIIDALSKAGFDDPTPVQRQALPILLAGRELLACAPTGSGKTLAFAIPAIVRLGAARDGGVRAVILSPTRELAAQSHRQVLRILEAAQPRKTRLRTCVLTKSETAGRDFSKVDILLATPLRLAQLVQEGKVPLGLVEILVLDEADKLFEMGFLEQIDSVVSGCTHKDVQRALFSATLPEQVEDLARSALQQPLRMTVGARNSAASSVDQKLLFVGTEEGKLLAMRQLLRDGGTRPPIMVFVQSKERAKQLHRELMFDGVNVDVIHADRSQAQRNDVVDNFRTGRVWVLIATDVMSRGMDFIGVNCVVNYDFPTSVSSYIHRIGRSGRAGRAGTAVTFYTQEDAGSLRAIANVMDASGCVVPPWMLQLKKGHLHRGQKKDWVPQRKDIGTMSGYEKNKASLKRQAVASSKARVAKKEKTG